MLISASRRTDIPAYYPQWFFNRLKEKYLLVPSPYQPKMISRVSLAPEVVDCIVFWTKNPQPMTAGLSRLKDYKYYFQFTLNAYGKEIESNIPSLSKRIEIFKRLSDQIGKEKVVWRYDPVLTNETYTTAYHQEKFGEIASALKDHTERCMLGFIDHYPHIRPAAGRHNIKPLAQEEIESIASSFKKTIDNYPVKLDACTVKVDLSRLGIPSGSCIDRQLIEKIIGCPIQAGKDKNQRSVCRCIESIDIGTYQSCLNGCIYCYAVKGSIDAVKYNFKQHNKHSPLLIGRINKDDMIKERQMKSLRTSQFSLF